jgi:putative redox protein
MANEEQAVLEKDLKGYKEKITATTKAILSWKGDLIFTGMTMQGYEIDFDAHAQMGCMPMEALLLSLTGCMGIDIINILQKMRVQISAFKIDVKGERNPEPPQYFKSVEMVLHLEGKDLEDRKIDRAVSLSRDKYCSVLNSLRQDLELKISYAVKEKEPSITAPAS